MSNGDKGFVVTLPELDINLIKMIAAELNITMGDVLTELWEDYDRYSKINEKKKDEIHRYILDVRPLVRTSFFVNYDVHTEVSHMQTENNLPNGMAIAAIILWSFGWEHLLCRYSSSLNGKANSAYNIVGDRIRNKSILL